jgi:hypothetical protein
MGLAAIEIELDRISLRDGAEVVFKPQTGAKSIDS